MCRSSCLLLTSGLLLYVTPNDHLDPNCKNWTLFMEVFVSSMACGTVIKIDFSVVPWAYFQIGIPDCSWECFLLHLITARQRTSHLVPVSLTACCGSRCWFLPTGGVPLSGSVLCLFHSSAMVHEWHIGKFILFIQIMYT